MSRLEHKFIETVPLIISNIISDVKALISNGRFYTIYSDFNDIYQMNFKRYFLEYFTMDSERFLEILSENLVHAFLSYYEITEINLNGIERFIELFIKRQFQLVQYYDLLFEN